MKRITARLQLNIKHLCQMKEKADLGGKRLGRMNIYMYSAPLKLLSRSTSGTYECMNNYTVVWDVIRSLF